MLVLCKVPVSTWYLAMAFTSFSKKAISVELQHQLNHPKYDKIWLLMRKIRSAMRKRDALCQLASEVEFDEGYFEWLHQKSLYFKRGKGSQRQVPVSVMVESSPLEDIETGIKSICCRCYKMKVLGNGVNQIIEESIYEKSFVFSDKSTSYVNIFNHVDVHIIAKSDNITNKNYLPWVYIAISNAKRTLLGIYHKVKGKYLQNYLDEFCYKLNKRYYRNNRFNKLVLDIANSYW